MKDTKSNTRFFLIYFLFKLDLNMFLVHPRELSSVSIDITYYMQGLWSEPEHTDSPQFNCVSSNH